MQDDLKPADAVPAMTTLLRHQHQQRAGRFGRAVPSDDVETPAKEAPTTTDAPRVDYVIDADAVAGAILARLVAGRTIRTRADRA